MSEKKKEFVSFNSHDGETFYRCPYCKRVFGDWSLFAGIGKRPKNCCPHCGKEFAEEVNGYGVNQL